MLLYPKNILEKLDFPFVLKELEHLCIGDLGRNLLVKQTFFTQQDSLVKQLRFVKETKEIIENDSQLPQYGFNELTFLHKLTIENYCLEIKELIDLYYMLTAAAEVFRFFTPKARQQLYPQLSEMVFAYSLEAGMVNIIAKVIDLDKETIKDNASPELSKIRKQIQDKIQEINSVFRKTLVQHKNQNVLSDTEETIRDGRRVLSVKSEYKRSIKGIITDESDSGSITYIEPAETVMLNNELVELGLEEKKEIYKILLSVTTAIRPNHESIEALKQLMAELDVIRAKAYFAIQYSCNLPQVSNEPLIYLRRFVHPVLLHHHRKHGKPVIDNTILLDNKNRVVVISGPNAGGKSIVLKSIGLIQLMFQFGMLIPADETSVMAVFDKLLVDIGDEQSIENDLSTYSSHLSNMQYFIANANAKTMVLIDEMGMGTDPALGGPMAEAILEALHHKNIFGVVTTHFNNLKVYAANTPFMLSGAMAFDTKHLRPLYQLQLGQPGSSFTFEIAKKSGLPDYIIKNAHNKIGDNKKALDDVLTDMQSEKQFIKGLRKNVQAKETQLHDLTKSYEQLNKDLEKEKKRILKQYESRLLDRFNEESRNLENEMRAWKEQKNNKEQFIETRKYIDNNRTTIEQKLEDSTPVNTPADNEKIQIGTIVKLIDGTETGEVLEIKNNHALVSFGNLQTRIKVHQLIPISSTSSQKIQHTNKYSSKLITEKSAFETNIDIRGLMKDEAITAIDIFMDKIVMYGIHSFKIIHGRGTGALKQVAHQFLKKYPHVKSFKHESEQYGGDGITIVEMK